MTRHFYTEVDVFSAAQYRGNALAVVHDATGLSTEQMQEFAIWTNLAETTFLLPPDDPRANYRVRIFTAKEELPFAGHPTLGSARAWLDAQETKPENGTVIQECAAGLVPVRATGQRLEFKAPPLTRYEPVEEADLQKVATVLNISREALLGASWLVNGPRWLGVRLASAQAVLDLRPNPALLGDLEIGVIGPYPHGAETQFEVRAFFGGEAVWEDPVTGSLNAGFARWLTDQNIAPRTYIASQGQAIGRQGRVHIRVEDQETIWVGGDVKNCIQGMIQF